MTAKENPKLSQWQTQEPIGSSSCTTVGCWATEYGAPEGVPLFYFHGFPGSRLDYLFFDAGEAAMEANARIVAADRPGYGLSSFQRGRRILDWPDDVNALADALQIDHFVVLGISGGGPYAAACAFKIPGRLIATGIVSGMGPPGAPGMKDGASWTLPGTPSLIRRLVLMLTAMGLQRDPDRFLDRSREAFSKLDARLLEQPDLAKVFVAGLQEAFRAGIGGANRDAALYAQPWGFQLQDVSAEVHLWHGEQDANVPVAVGHKVAQSLPNCNAKFYKEEGHLTLARNRITDILGKLVTEGSDP
jgi:pimeloyl-ACP methyl ester carboxylesterase